MATKKCTNGHLYDPAIYGDKCPFCPSSSDSTRVNPDVQGERTMVIGGGNVSKPTATIGVDDNDASGGRTVIRHVDSSVTGETMVGENRRVVGLLVSYSDNPCGEVYKLYEGTTTIGRDRTCDIPFPKDSHMSSKHLLIQYVAAKGIFKAKDLGSSNGSNVNGAIYVMDESIELKTNDKIVLGGTLFIFIAIPN